MARLLYRLRMIWWGLTLPRIAGAEDDSPPDDPPKDDPPKDDPPKDDPPDDPIKPEDDWQAKARKHERDLKKERKLREQQETELQKLKDADKSEQEKAVDKARKEGEETAQKAAEKERRSDRLEVAVTRLAAKGIKVGDGDESKTLRFQDAEDALLRVERKLARGEIDADELYDGEGRVKPEVLTTELTDILKANPYLAAEGAKPPPGDPDTGKGDPVDGDLDKMTPEDHARAKYAQK